MMVTPGFTDATPSPSSIPAALQVAIDVGGIGVSFVGADALENTVGRA